ncbi:C39 family peptidase [Patescibacteria group bacterium]|nr:C39 family peptidase [Patescibacteria group bacterium]
MKNLTKIFLIFFLSCAFIFSTGFFIVNLKAETSNQQIILSNNLNESEISTDNIIITAEKKLPSYVRHDVPFTAQAPFGDWNDVKQDYGCEEASIFMAIKWIEDKPFTKEEARDAIIDMAEFQLENYNHHHDTSIADTLKLLNDYYKYTNAFAQYSIGIDDIRNELANGSVVVIPIYGRFVDNPFYSDPAPTYHQVLVVGYDNNTQELIVHDPGTSRGKNFRYTYEEITNSLIDYETGKDEPLVQRRTAMLVIQPQK